MSAIATRFVHPMQFDGNYGDASWAGYKFAEALGYTSGRHTGVDYNLGAGDADKGLPAVSIANGTVRLREDLTSKGFGNTVIIEHPLPLVIANELGTSSLFSRQMHLLDFAVAVGQEVSVGQRIGRVGDSGTDWAHIHLDLWKANLGVHTRYDKDTQLANYLDPYLFIEKHKQATGGSVIPDLDNYYWRYGQDLATKLRGRQLTREEFRRHLVGKTDLQAIEILSDDPEAKTVQQWQEVGRVAVKDKWEQQIYDLQAKLKAAQTQDTYEPITDQLYRKK